MRHAWLLLIAFAACRATETPTQPTCATRSAQLKVLLAQLVDPAAQAKPPWPTGVPTTDRRIDEARAAQRAWLAPRPVSQRQPAMGNGITPGVLEHELAPCPPALAQLTSVGEVAPGSRAQAFTEIADRIATCDCHVDLPFISALFYMMQRGPD